MEINTIVDLIASVGFPIFCVLALFYFVFTIYKASEKREEALRQELVKNQEINSKAIETIALYAERLDTIQRDVSEIKDDIISITERIA
jgi:F0F1-type ATP synthase membrane subunit b/b'